MIHSQRMEVKRIATLRLSEELCVVQQWMNRLNRRAENLTIDRSTNYPEQDARHSWFEV